jgi:hypothetical protein
MPETLPFGKNQLPPIDGLIEAVQTLPRQLPVKFVKMDNGNAQSDRIPTPSPVNGSTIIIWTALVSSGDSVVGGKRVDSNSNPISPVSASPTTSIFGKFNNPVFNPMRKIGSLSIRTILTGVGKGII